MFQDIGQSRLDRQRDSSTSTCGRRRRHGVRRRKAGTGHYQGETKEGGRAGGTEGGCFEAEDRLGESDTVKLRVNTLAELIRYVFICDSRLIR
jgi:hypothetical protein